MTMIPNTNQANSQHIASQLDSIRTAMTQERLANPCPNFTPMIATLSTLSQDVPNRADILCLLGDAYRLNQNVALAIQTYEHALNCTDAQSNTLHDIYIGLSSVHTFFTNNYAEAHRYAELALHQQAVSIASLSLLGIITIEETNSVLTDEKRHQLSFLALNYAERILSIDANHIDGLAIALHIHSQKIDNPSKANEFAQQLEAILSQATTFDSYSLAYYEMAMYYLIQKQYAKLNEFLQSLIDAFPSAYFYSLLDTFKNSHLRANWENTSYLKAIEANPNDIDALQQLVVFESRVMQNHQQAETFGKQIVQQMQQHTDSKTLAMLLISSHALGHYEDSKTFETWLKQRQDVISVSELVKAYVFTDQIDACLDLIQTNPNQVNSIALAVLITELIKVDDVNRLSRVFKDLDQREFDGIEAFNLLSEITLKVISTWAKCDDTTLSVYQAMYDKLSKVELNTLYDYMSIAYCALMLGQVDHLKASCKAIVDTIEQEVSQLKTVSSLLQLGLDFVQWQDDCQDIEAFTGKRFRLGEISEDVETKLSNAPMQYLPNYNNVSNSLANMSEDSSIELLFEFELNNSRVEAEVLKLLSALPESTAEYHARLEQAKNDPAFVNTQLYFIEMARFYQNTDEALSREYFFKAEHAPIVPANRNFKEYKSQFSLVGVDWIEEISEILSDEDAINTLEQAFFKYANNPNVEGRIKAFMANRLLDHYALSRNLDKVIEWGNIYINQINAKSPRGYYEIGKMYMHQDNLEEALKWATKADEVSQHANYDSLFLLAIIYSKLEQTDRVQTCKNYLMKLSPNIIKLNSEIEISLDDMLDNMLNSLT